MTTHDDIPTPARMVDHTPSRKSHASPAEDMDLSALIQELKGDIAGLVQDSGVMINDHHRSVLAKMVRRWKHKRSLKAKSRTSLYRMAKAYMEKMKSEEQSKAVKTIQKGWGVPKNRQYHRSPSARVQAAREARFERLDQIPIQTDMEYFQWLDLNPKLSKEEKNRLKQKRKQESANRKKPSPGKSKQNTYFESRKQAVKKAVAKQAMSVQDWLKSTKK